MRREYSELRRCVCSRGGICLFCRKCRGDDLVTANIEPELFGGVCQPTAADATLNAGDLQTMLASGAVTVTTTGAGVEANDIAIAKGFSWSTASKLEFDAHSSIAIGQAVKVPGNGGLSLVTNKGGAGGSLAISGKGNITFKKLSSALSIDGKSYTLVNSVKSLASAVAANPKGRFALVESYDAQPDGNYPTAPVGEFAGTLEGLGNTISHLTIFDMNNSEDGLFDFIDHKGVVRDIGLPDVSIKNSNSAGFARAGALAAFSYGTVTRVYATGAVGCDDRFFSFDGGGLIGVNYGPVSDSWADVDIVAGEQAEIGGLIGNDHGAISQSFAGGSLSAYQQSDEGGLVGYVVGNVSITNSYATAAVGNQGFSLGGFIGMNLGSKKISSSYSSGAVTEAAGSSAGGFIGYDETGSRLARNYWDETTSGITDPTQGAGSVENDPGIKGLTDQQFQSRLPKGFDPAIWARDPAINGGLPYLINNPPQN